MYQAGCNPKLSKLYPAVEFPVSTSTPMISSLIKWQHEEQWETGMDDSKNSIRGEQDISVNFQKDRYLYLKDHIIDGRNMYPSLGYLVSILGKCTKFNLSFANANIFRYLYFRKWFGKWLLKCRKENQKQFQWYLKMYDLEEL